MICCGHDGSFGSELITKVDIQKIPIQSVLITGRDRTGICQCQLEFFLCLVTDFLFPPPIELTDTI